MFDEELGAEALQCLLDPLVRARVHQLEHVVKHRRGGRHEDAPLVEHEPLAQPLVVAVVTDGHSVSVRA